MTASHTSATTHRSRHSSTPRPHAYQLAFFDPTSPDFTTQLDDFLTAPTEPSSPESPSTESPSPESSSSEPFSPQPYTESSSLGSSPAQSSPTESSPSGPRSWEVLPPSQTSNQFRLRAVMVSTLDGAAIDSDGNSAGLGGQVDSALFQRSRMHSSAVLVGISTALTEEYDRITTAATDVEARARWGLPPGCDLVLICRSLTESRLAQICESSPLARHTAAPDGGTVGRVRLLIPESAFDKASPGSAVSREQAREALSALQVDMEVLPNAESLTIRKWLESRYTAVQFEGGPRMLGSMVENHGIDELMLTIHPGIQGGNSPRIAYTGFPDSDSAVTGRLTDGQLVAIARDQAGGLFVRYAFPS